MQTAAASNVMITLPKNDWPTANTKPTESDLLRARVQEYPFDVAGWRKFIVCAEDSGDIEKIETASLRPPLTASFSSVQSTAQISYIKHFLRPSAFGQAENLFERFLKRPQSVELSRFYLTYISILSRVGHERDSGDIWAGYITFLNAERVDSKSKQEQEADNLPQASLPLIDIRI
ncbi:hypothetical protein K435DRAFT_853511 [Dendrothele bispora CBS 962.96]|uniref:Suppressor of forked domain-containing protein n=1 Tax=Dendrothele bispora (strain CBS 962.96) TaxID=1314807 RepID=A0A4S8MGM8_DENBC|nr:hypothetical protein K435DRAFT_853511 [Dendrothele bispora CBS 962.96]